MSKLRYWKCVDCNSMINDENMMDLDKWNEVTWTKNRYAEFCYGCMNYEITVVLAYE